ncbi:MAG: hypothetical protein RL441_996, partial [Actinomycetota bacterium]
LHRVCAEVRYLGSYPRHDGAIPTVRQGVSDEDFSDASEWLSNLRAKGIS